ncbi:type 4 pilus major pilin [Xanthomonas axonopodis pv. poinsettiicola]|uniref:type 4 pilus major pilin n=1 Tax=Xanthomonas TaxID=338 RepID=UPI003557DD09
MRTQKQKQGLGLSPRVVSAAPPRLTPLASAFRAEHGFTLIETILGVGVALVISAGVFTVYQHASRAGEVRKEQANISAIADQTAKAYSALGSFADLTTAQAISSHVVPKPMVNGTVLRSVWGSGVDLEPTGVQGQSNNALKIIYDAVPDYACAKLAAATAEGAWDILVNGVSVLTARRLDVSGAANLCSDEAVAKMEFTYYGGASGLASTVLTPIVLKPYVPPAPVVPPAPPAPVPAGPPAVTPPGVAAPPVAVTPPTIPPITTTPTAPPSATPPSAPPAVGPSCVEPASFNESGQQTGACPSGQILASGASTFLQNRTRRNFYSCPDPWGTPVLNNGEWSGWTPSAASVCLPACVAPASTTRTETQQYSQSQTLSCQAGQTGSIAQIRLVTQSRTITTNYACPSPTGAVISSDSVGGWADSSYGAWQTTSTTCTAPAPPPAPQPPTYSYAIETMSTVGGACGLRIRIRSSGGSFTAIGTVKIGNRETDHTYNLSGGTNIVMGSSSESYTLTFYQAKNPSVRTNNISESAIDECQ